MNALQFWGAVEMGLIYGLVAMGVYLSFRILDFPDLTADGSFPLGAAVAGILIINGTNPWLATLAAMGGGALAGLFTAWLNVRWKILHLLASILTMTALYSINLRIMGRPNLALIDSDTVFTSLEWLNLDHMTLIIVSNAFFVTIVWFALSRFLRSEMGLGMRATGKNERMAVAQGVSTKTMKLSGIALSNALIALAGALFTQTLGFSDVNMGVGTIIVGLAAVMIGEVILPSRYIILTVLACIFGSIVYRLLLALALNSDFIGLQASDQNLVNAGLVALAMILSRVKNPFRFLKNKKAAA